MSALFPDLPAAIADMRSDRLAMMAATLLGGAFQPTDAYLASKLKAAEADASRRLRVALEPVRVFAGEPTEAELAALPEGMPWVEESAYDYEPMAWMSDTWGYLVLRKRPVISVESMRFIHPPANTVFEIPANWLRLDKQAGHVRVVPGMPGAGFGSLSLAAVSTMTAGRHIPDMIRIRYTAGLSNVATRWPDLIDTVKKMAVLRVVQDAYLPQSGSISADGLSESMSVDLQAYHDGIDAALDTLVDAIHGPRMIVA